MEVEPVAVAAPRGPVLLRLVRIAPRPDPLLELARALRRNGELNGYLGDRLHREALGHPLFGDASQVECLVGECVDRPADLELLVAAGRRVEAGEVCLVGVAQGLARL